MALVTTSNQSGGTLPASPKANLLPPGEGTAFWFVTDLYTAKLVGDETDGAFTLFEALAAPRSPQLPHMHHREDEIYYVLEGEFEFVDDDRTFTAGPGSVVHLARDRFHSHRNPGDVPAKALVLYRPAGIENFIVEAGKPATDPSALPPPPDDADFARLMAAASKYGFETPPAAPA